VENARVAYRQRMDRQFINDPDRWPAWPALPMKRSHDLPAPHAGVMFADTVPVKPIVYLANVWHLPSDFSVIPKKEYKTLEEMQADGWWVD
jgi:hypothetical protein